MYFSPRGADQRKHYEADIFTAQKYLDILASNKSILPFFDKFAIKRIVLVPFNHFSQCMVKTIGKDIEIVAIVDQQFKKWPKGFRNINIVGYDDLKEADFDMVVVTNNFYQNQIIDTLTDKGVTLNKIIGINTILYGAERLPK